MRVSSKTRVSLAMSAKRLGKRMELVSDAVDLQNLAMYRERFQPKIYD